VNGSVPVFFTPLLLTLGTNILFSILSSDTPYQCSSLDRQTRPTQNIWQKSRYCEFYN